MSIPFRCTACQARLSVSDNKAGNQINCPKCQASQFVPAVAATNEAVTTTPAKTDLRVFAGLADSPAAFPSSINPSAAPARPLPPIYLAGGSLLALLLCVGVYLAASSSAKDDPDENKPDRGIVQPPVVPPLHLAGGSEPPLPSPLDLTPPEKPKPKPEEKPDYTPKPEDPKKPPMPPKMIDEPMDKDPPPVRIAEFVVKRRQKLDDETLRKQLLSMRELNVDAARGTSAGLIANAIQAKARNQKYPGPMAYLGHRSDLSGLPMRMGNDCQLGKEPAENLQVLSRKLRVLLENSIPRDGIEVRPDPLMLKNLLMNGGQADFANFAPARFGRAPRLAVEGRPQDWLTPEAIPALMQLLMAENSSTRTVLVEVLGRIKGKAATEALVNRALMDLSPAVREQALRELKDRPVEDYAAGLLKGMRYPWSPVADHAAEALATLEVKDAVPNLVRMLSEPDVDAPITVGRGTSAYTAQREVVRINHLGNCILCHAPSLDRTEFVRGAMPSPGQALPAPATTPQYYERGSGVFVRADITYLRQDFSVVQPVPNHGVWPEYQRFDYLIRHRPLNATEASTIQDKIKERKSSAHREATLFALRELTGKDLGKTAADWSALLPKQP